MNEPSKYCDLVMKGGITSGIVYPKAVLALAKEFRVKNIGGTSAGAMAAAVCAAAAFGDRAKHDQPPLEDPGGKAGFEGMERVAKYLATEGFIYGLFQPAWGAKNAFRLVVILAGNAPVWRKIFALVIAVIAIAPLETLLVLALLVGIGYMEARWPGVKSALLPSLVCAYAAGALGSVLRVARIARRNLLGLCTGRSRRDLWRKGKPALTEWLHGVLQELSGKPIEQPLTFGELWRANRYEGEPTSAHAITLQMITTDVSHHEPRTLPFEDASYWFRRDQFDLLFPREVVDWMVKQVPAPNRVAGVDYYLLPESGKLPVVVGARMSLSFPLLISAVPLHEPKTRVRSDMIDESAAEADAYAVRPRSLLESADLLAGGGKHKASTITEFRVCWFSDGGVSSNFPIHLFDGPLPVWPTFAIDLIYPDTADNEGTDQPDVFLPTRNNQGWQRNYQSIAEKVALKELAGFVFGLISTMQNWRDLLQSRAPGHRDRIVHVALTRSEGGMNLNMPQHILDDISGKGTRAGEAFKAFSFRNHYWIRWRNLASALQRYTVNIADSVNSKPKIPAYSDAYQTAETGVPPPPSYPFRSQERQAEAEGLLHRLTSEGQKWKDAGPDLTTGAPRPLPQLQIGPTY
jgi:Patatin-like phospholipase